MFIYFGRHRWQSQIRGYRHDYCLTCDSATVSVEQETNDFFHLYWIPVLPLGRRRHWHCIECDSDPHERVRTRRSVKLVGGLLASFASLILLLFVLLSPPGFADLPVLIAFLIGCLIVAILFFVAWWRHQEQTPLHEQLAVIPDLLPTECLYCELPMQEGSQFCDACGTEYHPTPRNL